MSDYSAAPNGFRLEYVTNGRCLCPTTLWLLMASDWSMSLMVGVCVRLLCGS